MIEIPADVQVIIVSLTMFSLTCLVAATTVEDSDDA